MGAMGKNLLKNSGNGCSTYADKDGTGCKPGASDSTQDESFSTKKRSELSENARRVLEKRYLVKDERGEITETPDDLFLRVAHNISKGDLAFDSEADIKESEEKFYSMMTSLEFLPNSPTLMNAGRSLQQLSACFVLPVGDSMEEIFTTIKDTALIHKSGGGTGFSFSRLRPANSRVASTNGVSSGPISFMRVFDSATEAIKQGGTRRGANMGILRVDHPDIDSFITCKEDEKSFNNFNISLALTEEFLKREAMDEEYELLDPCTKLVARKARAKDIFDRVISSAWKNGEPGIVFIDRINRDNPTPHTGEIESTNPCGEQPLLPYESCNLGSLNLSRMLKTGGEKPYEIDWDKLSASIHGAVHFLDNVIEMNRYPLDKIRDTTLGNRKIGLGVMGFADMLIRLAIPYNSDRAIKVAEEVMSFIDKESKKASAEFADRRGVFPNYNGSIFDVNNTSSGSAYQGWRLRNATTTTIAPTGTISIIANTSSGVEPLFAVSYLRTVMDNDELVEVHPIFEEVSRERGFYSEELMKKIAHQGHLDNIDEIPDDVKTLFVTAHNVSPEWHVKMQAAFQRHTDNAVSKTINFNNDATEEDVREAFLLAAKLGCKGITIYRDGSREGQVLSTGSTYSSSGEPSQAPADHPSYTTHVVPRPRPATTRGTTRRVASGCGSLYVTINECDKGRPFEIFTQMGKAGGCAASQSEAIGRLVSLSLRSGIEPGEIIKQLTGISCHMMTWDNGEKILSCSDAISKAISAYIKTTGEAPRKNLSEEKGGSGDGAERESSPVNGSKIKAVQPLSLGCPDCGSQTEQADGCVVCRNCGYSKC